MRPTLSFNYSPDLNQNHLRTVQVDSTGKTLTYNDIGGGVVSYSGGRDFAGMFRRCRNRKYFRSALLLVAGRKMGLADVADERRRIKQRLHDPAIHNCRVGN